jgi:hypothetical protein
MAESIDDLFSKYGATDIAPQVQKLPQKPIEPVMAQAQAPVVQQPQQDQLQIMPSSLEDVGVGLVKNLGIMGRSAVEGGAGIVGAVADPLTIFLNQVLPKEWQQLPPSQGLHQFLTSIGVPEADTTAQKILGAVTQGVAGGGSTVGLGKAIGGGIGTAMAANPVGQLVGGAGSGLGAETAGQLTNNDPTARLVGGIAGGVVGGLTPAGTKTVYRTEEVTPEAIGKLVKQASGGFGSSAAKAKLVQMAEVNPEARDAAKSLGIDLPADVFSDNPQVKAAAGLTRSVVGSDAQGVWVDAVKKANERADQIVAEFDAPFIEGRPSTAVVSSQVKNALIDSKKALEEQATKLSDEVNSAVPPASPASTANIKAYIEQKVKDLGGEENLSSYEKKLLKLAQNPNTTYALLNRERNLIGENLGKVKTDMFGDTHTADLKQIYNALKQDRLDTVAILGDKELAQKLSASNDLYTKAFSVGDRITDAFGKSGGGDIATDLPAAILSAGKGIGENLNRILQIVPEDLHKQSVATALATATRAKGGAEKGGFGFSEFSTLYPALRANPESYAKITKALGPGSDDILRSLYLVSKRLTDARANVLTTGKANQALLNAMTGETLIDKTLAWAGKSTVGKIPIVGEGFAEALDNGSKVKLEKAGKLFASDAFQNAIDGKTPVTSILDSPEFKVYADTVKIPLNERQQWLLSVVGNQKSASDRVKENK